MIKNRNNITQTRLASLAKREKFYKRTSQLHINPKLHKKFKLFCIDINKPMQEVTEKLIINVMKHPERV